MFCPHCGTRLPEEAKFCSECGGAIRPISRVFPDPAPAPAAAIPPAVSPAQPPPILVATGPPPPAAQPVAISPVAPPRTAPLPVAVPLVSGTVTESPGTEIVIQFQKAVSTKPPRGWRRNYDLLITNRRLIGKKTGFLGNLAKGLSKGIPAGAISSVGVALVTTLGAAIQSARLPLLDSSRAVPLAEIDAFAAGESDGFQIPWDQATACELKIGGLFSIARIKVQSHGGAVDAEIKDTKELQPILSQILGSRLTIK